VSATDQREALSGTLERGLAILERVADGGEPTPAALSEGLGLSRSATYRLVDRLRALGYLEAARGGERLRLGRKAARLGMAAVGSIDVMRVAPAVLRGLAEAAGEGVHLAVLDGPSVVYLLKEEGPQTVRMSAQLGSRRPVHATGLGKAFLAALADDERAALLRDYAFERLTPNTITDRARLEDELARTRQRGYAVDNVEVEPGVACFAAAVRDFQGRPVAAISVAGPAERVLAGEGRIGPLVRDAAADLSGRLGHTRPSTP
jgi:DNA-binding IclR family transcriptional regulator